MVSVLHNLISQFLRFISFGIIAVILWLFSCTRRESVISQCEGQSSKESDKPNVILIITDDQGYGDLACHGNSIIKTPNLDMLYSKSVRLTNFHVSPTCSPTRAALLTGRYNDRTGVWHTIMGRSLLCKDEVTMADIFRENGYITGIFGKWHLGDNYPFRPQDRGFKEVLINGGGGVGQTPDYWGNDYFDDTYFHNGKVEKFTGYCTDVWFDNAIKFIEENKDHPFFVYLPTNAPHGPYIVAEKYSKLYSTQGVPSPRDAFYGMITNIDENIGKLVSKLRELALEENTILIFTTDNGTSEGVKLNNRGFQVDGFNHGMRGKKGSVYDGGHHAPFFIYWSLGGIEGGRDIDYITAHIDLLPTLIDLCGLKIPEVIKFDGISLGPLLKGDANNWSERTLFVDNQRLEYLRKYKQFVVMTNRWRLVGNYGNNVTYRNDTLGPNLPMVKSPREELELYDMKFDTGQKKDIADKHPEVVKRLFETYEDWWTDISNSVDDYCWIILGSDKENPALLTAHDWHVGSGEVPWNQRFISKGLKGNGFWAVEIARESTYQISLRRWPEEVNKPINAAIPGGKSISATTARLKIGDIDISKPIPKDSAAVRFQVNLKPGKTQLQTLFVDENGDSMGAYYVYVIRLP